jgi:hypothetical protein
MQLLRVTSIEQSASRNALASAEGQLRMSCIVPMVFYSRDDA